MSLSDTETRGLKRGRLGFRRLWTRWTRLLGPRRLGLHGENLACRELKRRGYIIEARRVRTSLGEIDVVARDGTALVFVEVKTRRSRGHGSPAEAVTRRKQRKLSVLARAYLARKNLGEVPVRFDVVAVDWSERDGPRVDIVRGAFQGLPD